MADENRGQISINYSLQCSSLFMKTTTQRWKIMTLPCYVIIYIICIIIFSKKLYHGFVSELNFKFQQELFIK